MSDEMLCRSATTMGFDPAPRGTSTYTWARDDDEPPRQRAVATKSASTMRLVREPDPVALLSGTTVDVLIRPDDDEALLEPLVPVVRVERPRYAIRGRVRVLPRRVAHISQSLLDLSVDDE